MTKPQDDVVEALEALLPSLGTLPLSEDWMYSAVRHCQRNMDFDFEDGGNEPDRYAGTALAKLANLLPTILTALRANQRNAVVEECARVALNRFPVAKHGHDDEWVWVAGQIAKAIRALATNEQDDE